MFTPQEKEGMPIKLERQFKDLENRVMSDVVRRVKINSEITSSADWQIQRMVQLGESKDNIKNYIKQALNLSDKEVDDLYSGAIKSGYTRNEVIYKSLGADFVPFDENRQLQSLISAVTAQTKGELENITGSLGFAVKKNGKLMFTPLAEYYQNTLDGAILDITTGAFDYNTVLKRIVSEMTNSGLRTVDYDSGWSNRIDVAARRALMTGIAQVTAQVNENTAADLGTDSFEVSYHVGARPTHQIWQGRVYTHDELETVCGLGSVTGLCGANCYHDYYPFIPGVSERSYTDEQLAAMNAEENTPKEFNGKQYTAYEALQKQRRLETTMRAQREQIKLLQEGGASEDDVIAARCRYRVTSGEYSRFSSAVGLPQQRQRIYGDGLGGVGIGKTKTIANTAHSGIINTGSDDVAEFIQLGTIDIQPLEKEFGKLKTNEIVITNERIAHIKLRHLEDYDLFKEYGKSAVESPDLVIKDCKNQDTVFMVKKLDDTNLNVIAKLILDEDEKDYKNSVMTFYRIRNKNLIKLEKKNKTLYKRE